MHAPQICHSKLNNFVASAVNAIYSPVVIYVDLFNACVGFPFFPILANNTPIIDASNPSAA